MMHSTFPPPFSKGGQGDLKAYNLGNHTEAQRHRATKGKMDLSPMFQNWNGFSPVSLSIYICIGLTMET